VRPRFRPRPRISFEQLIARARVDEAATVISLDLRCAFFDAMTDLACRQYRRYRWVVIPHALAANFPVIYALPPMHMADECPWESWYTTDGLRVIHHVHFTKPNERATGQWRERDGAPQRPPEVCGVDWYWYDDPSMTPSLANAAQGDALASLARSH
jgi:hypothetical protein